MSYEYSPVDEMVTFNGVAWIANIYDNHRNLICEVMNQGDGGANTYRWHSDEGREAMIRNAQEDFVGSMEPLDEFVHALWLDEFAGFSKPEEDLF